MDPLTSAALVQSVGPVLQAGLGPLSTYLNYKYQDRLSDKQNQYNLDMWHLQNEYNSPQAQMRRYEEAGLNPALIYSQGNPGNASSAPQMVTPNAPDFSKDVRELSKVFNIEGLKTMIANRQKAQAEARHANAIADDAESDNKSLRDLYWDYSFDPTSGRFVYDGGILSRNGDNFVAKPVYNTVGAMARAKAMRILADNYRTNALLVPRAGLIGSQSVLNNKRQELLAPQIRYWNFNATPWRMKTNFWIGNVKNGLQAVAPFITPFF